MLSDITNARRWNTWWTRIEVTSGQAHGAGTTFRAYTEGGDTYDFTVSDWVAPEYIAFRPLRDESERHNIMLESQAFRLQPAGEDSTIVELTSRASAHGLRGWFLGLFFWSGYQKPGLNAALDALQAVFEGEGSAHATDVEAPSGSE